MTRPPSGSFTGGTARYAGFGQPPPQDKGKNKVPQIRASMEFLLLNNAIVQNVRRLTTSSYIIYFVYYVNSIITYFNNTILMYFRNNVFVYFSNKEI